MLPGQDAPATARAHDHADAVRFAVGWPVHRERLIGHIVQHCRVTRGAHRSPERDFGAHALQRCRWAIGPEADHVMGQGGHASFLSLAASVEHQSKNQCGSASFHTPQRADRSELCSDLMISNRVRQLGLYFGQCDLKTVLNFAKIDVQPFSCALAIASFARPECRSVIRVPSPVCRNVTVTIDSSPKVLRDTQSY